MTDPERNHDEHKNTACPICDGSDFSWGHLQGSGLTVIEDDSPLLAKILTMGLRVRARICKSCRNVQLFAG